MRKFMVMVVLVVLTSMVLFGCSGGFIADYSTEEFETALNNGEDVTGKTVVVKVSEVTNGNGFAYIIQAGEHLNFVSADKPEVEPGDEIVVTVDRVANLFGSWIVTYTK